MNCNNHNLGEEEFLIGYTFLGVPAAPDLVDIMLEVIAAIGMTPDGPPKIDIFPNYNGCGGIGCQIYQVLTESWIIGGTWPIYNKTRIVLSSCKEYDQNVAIKIMESRIGKLLPTVGGCFNL